MSSTLYTLLSNVGNIWIHSSISKQLKISALIITIQIAIITYYFPKLPPEIPLFFSRPWGDAQLQNPITIIILPVFSIIFLIINSLVSTIFITKEAFLAQLLAYGSTLFAVFNLIALIKIITLVL